MKKIDFLSLDGRSLQTFLAVLEEMSISNAANRLGVTQSAVSHLLDKLRLALGDPLFVRAGRGIAATERALALHGPVQALLDGLKELTDDRVFDPLVGQMDFTIAANDFQRDLIFPGLIPEISAEGVDVRFRFIPSGIPALDLLRQARCQLIVTPFPPEGPDIYQVRLFEDHLMCFYDAAMRDPPRTKEEYGRAAYLEVRFEDDEAAAKTLYQTAGILRGPPRISVPNFSALRAFLRGSEMITTQLSLMAQINLEGLASAPLPFDTAAVPMYMVWHKRDHRDATSRWLRGRIKAFVEQLLPE